MKKEDFIARLKENKKEFDTIEELLKYQLPVLQYYLENYQPSWYDMDISKLNVVVDFSKITITPSTSQQSIQLMNVAFEGLTKRIGEFENDKL